MSAHTPGPWHWHVCLTRQHLHDESGSCFAQVSMPSPHVMGIQESPLYRANAALIASAPDLLALAKQYASECAECNGTGLVSRSYGGDGYGNRCAALADADDQPCSQCEDIRAVIARAEGRS